MITCPNCGNKELHGALFCQECGAQFPKSNGDNTLDVEMSPELAVRKEAGLKPPSAGNLHSPYPEAILTLHILGKGAFIPIIEEGEIVLGRSSEGQPVLPDIDLVPFQAFEAGVSRIHAAIQVRKDAIMIADLGSFNGTSVNGIKVAPHETRPLNDGDLVCLGKLKIEVIAR